MNRSGTYQGSDQETEIRRLTELMPASGRMLTKIQSQPKQSRVIDAQFPKPWQLGDRLIKINFTLWWELPIQERDLLLLSVVCRLANIRWFKADVYQGLTMAGITGIGFQLWQRDVVGLIVAGGLTAMAARQIWQGYQSNEREIEADTQAVKVAVRRGYEQREAINALLMAIESVARIENRSSLSFTELLRTQNLRLQLSNQASPAQSRS
ncbi:MAG: DUF3318 domain-containing protein [Synechocystis sp.]|jgi:hypothetical protein